MKRIIFLTLATALVFGLVWLVGCSDDSDNGTGSNLPAGDTNALDYQFVESELIDGELLSGIDITLMMSTMLVDSIPGATTVGHSLSPALSQQEDMDVVITDGGWTYSGGWHVFSLTGYFIFYDYDGNDTVDFDGVDSIQILAGGIVQIVPDSTMDELRYRAHFVVNSRAGDYSRAIAHNVRMERIAGGEDMVEINGTFVESVEAQLSDSTGTCTVEYGANMTASGIKLDMATDGCPEAGSLDATIALNVGCVGTGGLTMSINGTWTVSATFNGLTETYVISNGTNQWTKTESCG